MDNTVTLTYDALGRAVEQARGTVYTQILYGPGGGKLALMSGQTVQKAFIPLPGGATAVYNSAGLAYYRHSDWLGSSRLATTPSRTLFADVQYGPYGEPYGASGSADVNFTGQNQDTAGGLYDFLFREYNTNHSRWVSPDPAGLSAVNMGAPQTWNRYAYVGNRPLTSVDPLGLRDPSAYDQVGFNNSCSINGTPANCGMAISLLSMGGGALSMGGGGAVAFMCPNNDCNDFLSLQSSVGPDNQIYRWTPGAQPIGPCDAGDSYGTGAQYTCAGGPWTLKPTGEFLAANNGPDPVAVANSMRQYVKYTLIINPLQQLKNKVVWYFCGSSPEGAVENWMETGATKGAIGGAIAGAGAMGVETFGFGGVPGAIIGGHIGATAGAGGGVLFGGMAAAGCSAAGVYGH